MVGKFYKEDEMPSAHARFDKCKTSVYYKEVRKIGYMFFFFFLFLFTKGKVGAGYIRTSIECVMETSSFKRLFF